MNLRITKNNEAPDDTNSQWVKCSMLSSNGVHMFIASNSWETAYIELCDDLPTEKLRYLSSKCNNILIKKTPDMSEHIDVLIDLFPDKGGLLRRCKLSNGNVTEVIKENLYE